MKRTLHAQRLHQTESKSRPYAKNKNANNFNERHETTKHQGGSFDKAVLLITEVKWSFAENRLPGVSIE